MRRVRARARATRLVSHGDPAPAPLLGDIGGGAAAAGGVEHQVAGVGGHQEAALDDSVIRLNDVDLVVSELRLSRVVQVLSSG